MTLSLENRSQVDETALIELEERQHSSNCAESKELTSVLAALSDAFGEPFTVIDVDSGALIHSDFEGLGCYLYDRVELLAEVNRRGKSDIVEDVSPLVMLAIPLCELGVGTNLIAVGVFVSQQVQSEDEIKEASRIFGLDAGLALRWSTDRAIWQPSVLLRVACTVHQNLLQQQQLSRLKAEIADATAHTDDIYAELELLHRLTRQLRLSEYEGELWRNALEWLADTVPAQSLAMVLCDCPDELRTTDSDQWEVLVVGECPVEAAELRELMRRFGESAYQRAIVLNRAETTLPTWHCPTVRELVSVPIDNGEQILGWVLALNHRGDASTTFSEFGSVEIQLLRSVGTILGIHSSNLELYREQSQLFASSVQALISAIDAKDRYTAGHSNRVAHFSASLAKHLGFGRDDCDTIFLAGLLHDIGKIGIDDQVLNKPGKLTEEEFEHIKQHPKLGYEILKGVEPLDKVLPIVLHHHEAWDGSGYPDGLRETATPRMARILAVADAYDAMSSDRPYRKGMPEEQLDTVLRRGAGRQWDPQVIDAFFEIREEIREIEKATANDASIDYPSALH